MVTRTGDPEIGAVSRRLPDNPGELACMQIYLTVCRQSNLDSIQDDILEEEGTIQVESASLSSSHSDWKSMGNFLRISLDNNQSTVIPLHNEMTVLEVVENTCSKRQLEPEAYFLKLGVEDSSGSTGDSFYM